MVAELALGLLSPKSPDEWLAASMRAGRRTVVYEAMQRDLFGDGTHRRIRISRDAAGRMRSEILAPSSLAGSVTIDDRHSILIYLPTERRITLQPSLPREDDAWSRMRLARLNYRLRLGRKEKVAGRPTQVVIATPRANGLLERRFWVDTVSFLPLRMELRQGERAITTLDVRKISYPPSLPTGTFRFARPAGVTVERMLPPVTVSRQSAERRCGFAPILPDSLPFGYRIERLDITPMERWSLLAVTLSDGLSRVMVYQVPVGAEVGAWARDGVVAGPVRLVISSDLLPAHRQKILAAFTAAAEAVPETFEAR